MLIDTDAKNEIDDQFAIVRALIAPELRVEAITAAGYHDRESGAQRSFDEVERILKLMNLSETIPVALGSPGPMKDKTTPLASDATSLIIKHGQTPAWGIGCYNWTNDVPAVQVIFESDVRYIHMPARSVSEKMYIAREEIPKHLSGRGPIYDFLISLWNEGRFRNLQGKILWDIALVHVMIDPSHGKRVTVGAPVVNDDGTTRDSPANPRKVDVYADIDAEEIYRSFWKAAS